MCFGHDAELERIYQYKGQTGTTNKKTGHDWNYYKYGEFQTHTRKFMFKGYLAYTKYQIVPLADISKT